MNRGTSKPSVMHIISDLELGGAQAVVCTLGENWKFQEGGFVVCAFRDGPLRSRLEAAGVPVEILPFRRRSVLLLPLCLADLWRIRHKLMQLVKVYKSNLIQTHILIHLDFLALSFRNRVSVKCVLWTVHGVDFLPQRPGWFLPLRRAIVLRMYRLLLKKVDGIIAVSDAVREALLKRLGPFQSKILTIPNAVNLKDFEKFYDPVALRKQFGFADSTRLLVSVGRLSKEKGHSYLVDATAKVIDLFPDTHLLIAGDGELRPELTVRASQMDCRDKIHFLGQRTDMAALLMAADVFVLPSLREGLSMALLEAMAAGKPIVATAIPGNQEVLIDGQTGLLVAPSDSLALANAIGSLLKKPGEAQAMGKAARAYVQTHYDVERQVKEYQALYHRFLNPTAPLIEESSDLGDSGTQGSR